MDKDTLKLMTTPELVIMQHELRKFPEDKEELGDVMDILKERQTDKQGIVYEQVKKDD